MESQKNSFRPGSKTDWRKRQLSITNYIVEMESCLESARKAVFERDAVIEGLKLRLQSESETVNRFLAERGRQ